MHLLRELAEHLAFCGQGIPDETIFWGRMPDSPDACIGILSEDSAMPGDEDGARVQLLSRAAAPGEAYGAACRLARALDGFNGFLAGWGRVAKIDVLSAAVGLAPDGKKREMYATNIRVRYGAEEMGGFDGEGQKERVPHQYP